MYVCAELNRSLTNPDEVANLRSNAQAFGVDLDHHWAEREYSINIQTALTAALAKIAGSADAAVRAKITPLRAA